ncbi:hypothetical protein ABE10_01135, partial [Bacillus toyonensis]|nr:hypothetical protein [Bacillus toyonensis]
LPSHSSPALNASAKPETPCDDRWGVRASGPRPPKVGTGCLRRHTNRSAARLLHHLGRLDLVADLDVVVFAEADTALEVGADLGDVVLEPTQRLDGQTISDHDAVTDHTRLGVARDRAGADDDAGDVAELRGTEHLPDLGHTRLDLFELRLEHALERVLDLLDGVVDHRVEADVHAFPGRGLACLGVRADVEAHDDRVVDRREVDVRLRDGADAAMDDPQLHRVVDLDLEQRLLQRLDRTGDV